jgi:dephospho-CoA kinase
MKLVGLTGGIASGKSTVGRMLRARGVDVIDADVLARDAVAPGTPGFAAVVARFGAGVVRDDGTLDRAALGRIVFADDEARRALNHIVHPEVARLAAEAFADVAARGAPVVVYEVPLLFENGLQAAMDVTMLVAVHDDVQLQRLLARDGCSEAEARARIRSQMPLEQKRKLATHVLENDGTVADLAHALRTVWRTISGDDVDFS